jgi:predicted RNA-binding Zn-ribbon protein involved in translation (DUF1610 family)
MTGTMLPCAECGIDLAKRDCEETTATVEIGIGRQLFGQTAAEREVSAWVCPECGHVQAL